MRFFTRFIFLPAFSLAALATLSACGHNAVVFGKGVGFRAGLDPEHLAADFSLVYGEQLTLAGRDNIKIRLKTGVSGGSEAAAADATADSVLEISIGPQLNGYFVEAVEAGATSGQIRALQSSAASSSD